MQLIDENVARIEQKMNQSVLFSDWLFGKPVYDLEATVPFRRSDGDEYENIKLVGMSPAYLQMFGFELIEGRLWDSTDIHNPERLILNEAARDLFHITDIQMERIMPERSLTRDAIIQSYEIAGIIRNFQTGHLSKTPTPIAIYYIEQGHHYDYLMARFIPGRKDEAVTFLKNLYREINGNRSFSYSTLDEKIAELYVEDRRVSNVNNLFALLAVVISCMGLFAISLFDMQQRKREIALRKINGASAKDVMLLLLKKYICLIGISFAVAAPLSYWFIGRYMEHFAHATPISCWLFVLAAIIVTVLSLSTLTWQIQQAMRTDPSTVLKEG
jgi:ABC-type antimicrobial peptide transport system permease subunit